MRYLAPVVVAAALVACGSFGKDSTETPAPPTPPPTEDAGGGVVPEAGPVGDAGTDAATSPFVADFDGDPPTAPFGWSEMLGKNPTLTTNLPHDGPSALETFGQSGANSTLDYFVPEGVTQFGITGFMRIDSLVGSGAVASLVELACAANAADEVRTEIKATGPTGPVVMKATNDQGAAKEYQLAPAATVGQWLEFKLDAVILPASVEITTTYAGYTYKSTSNVTCTGGPRAQIGVRYSGGPYPAAAFKTSYDTVRITWK